MSQRILNQLTDQINALIETAEDMAREDDLSFTVKFGNGEEVTQSWESSWASSSC